MWKADFVFLAGVPFEVVNVRHVEGSNRTPCIVRWPHKVPAGKVSHELVHEVDLFTTLVLAGGGKVPC